MNAGTEPPIAKNFRGQESVSHVPARRKVEAPSPVVSPRRGRAVGSIKSPSLARLAGCKRENASPQAELCKRLCKSAPISAPVWGSKSSSPIRHANNAFPRRRALCIFSLAPEPIFPRALTGTLPRNPPSSVSIGFFDDPARVRHTRHAACEPCIHADWRMTGFR